MGSLHMLNSPGFQGRSLSPDTVPMEGGCVIDWCLCWVITNNQQDVFCSDQLHLVEIVRFGVWESETARYLQIGTSEFAVSIGYSILM